MTEETKRDIRIYNHHGWTYSQIAKRTGAKFSEIKNAIKEENTEMAKKLSQEQYDIITAGLKDRKPHEVIAEEAGVHRNTVYRFAKDIRAEKEKEPETAATETGSTESVCENVSEPIIPETEKNVKTPIENLSGALSDFSKTAENCFCGNGKSDIPPEIIALALTNQLQDEMRRVKEADKYIAELTAKAEAEKTLREEAQNHIKELRAYITKIGYGDTLIAFDSDPDSIAVGRKTR